MSRITDALVELSAALGEFDVTPNRVIISMPVEGVARLKASIDSRLLRPDRRLPKRSMCIIAGITIHGERTPDNLDWGMADLLDVAGDRTAHLRN